jgi:hypothetical protein
MSFRFAFGLLLTAILPLGRSPDLDSDVRETQLVPTAPANAPRSEADQRRALHAAMIRATQEDAGPEYAWHVVSGTLRGEGPAGRFALVDGRLELSNAEDASEDAAFHVALEVTGIGRADHAATSFGDTAIDEALPNAAERVARGVHERWLHGPLGVEHTLELVAAPEGAGDLIVELSVDGLSPRTEAEDTVALVDAAGLVRARYAGLFVEDATGAALPATMFATNGTIRIRIDDEMAVYPIAIDPLVAALDGTLTVSDAADMDQLGIAVALSSDGRVAFAGARYDSAGSVRIFTRGGLGGWSSTSRTLRPGDGSGLDNFGSSVAISADGTTLVVGMPYDDTGAGSDAGTARVFVGSGSTFTEEATLGGAAAGDQLGDSVAVSADGNTAIVGAPLDDTAGANAGSARVYVRSGTTWSSQAALDGAGASHGCGRGVALSSDGNTALVGCPGDSGGTVRVFVRSGTTWSAEASLPPTGASTGGLGDSVAVSADGNTVIAGAPSAGGGGNARIFVRSGTTWSAEVTLSTGSTAFDYYGCSVAISADGNRAVVGERGRASNAGGGRLYARTGTTWTEAATLQRAIPASGEQLGYAVSIAGDGSGAFLGAPFYSSPTVSLMGRAVSFSIRTTGNSCTDASDCETAFCVDGVCCDTSCGGGMDDCQACSAAAGGMEDGRCGPLTATAAAAITCRPSADACDAVETCTSTTEFCGADRREAAGTECAPSSCAEGVATPAAVCDGTSPTCPAATTVSCGDYACGADACLTSCTSAADCSAGRMCIGGVCTTSADAGMPDGGGSDGAVTMPDGSTSDGAVSMPDGEMPGDASTESDASADTGGATGDDAGGGSTSSSGCCSVAGTKGDERGRYFCLGLLVVIAWRRRRARR